jgi:Skp family chaperone for outer membrane proteins
MRPSGPRGVVVLVAVSLLATGVSSSTASAASGAPAAATAGATDAAAARADTVAWRKSDLDKEIADIRESLEGTSQDLVAAVVALKRSEAGLVTVRAGLSDARNALAAAERRDGWLASDLAYAKAEEDKAVTGLAVQAKTRRRPEPGSAGSPAMRTSARR